MAGKSNKVAGPWARVTSAFKGVLDGEVQASQVKVDDVIGGSLGQVAIDEEWATEISEAEAAKLMAEAEKKAHLDPDLETGAVQGLSSKSVAKPAAKKGGAKKVAAKK